MLAKTKKKIKRVAFFGDAMLTPIDPTYVLAEETASLLAKNGFIVINGGGPGIMGAATIGAKKSGGVVELVILDPKKEPKNYEGTSKENLAYAKKIYTVDNYQDRVEKLIELADAFVIFKGGTGTLSEVGMVWEMAKFQFGKHEPLIFVGAEWKEIVSTIEKNMKYEEIEKRVVTTVDTAGSVLRALKRVEN